MRKLLVIFVANFALFSLGFGQYATVNFDLEKNYFNEGQPLPAERPLMFTGLVPNGIDIIEIGIFPAKFKNEEDRLYLATWKDYDQADNTNYSLAVNYPLRASQTYDFQIAYFQTIDEGARQQLTEQIIAQVTDYLTANISIKGKSISLAQGEKRMVKELNSIIADALREYRSQEEMNFSGLSGTVQRKLANLEEVSFDKLPRDSTAQQEKMGRSTMVNNRILDLQQVVATEIQDLMNKQWSRLTLSRYVDDYATESKRGFLSFNIGYGGVYLDGKLSDFTYGSAPYAGLSFPLGNSTLAPRFLRNSSLTLGVFLDNFTDENGRKVSGVIVGRPLYLGLDYKLFEFVRFNAGAALLEGTELTPIEGSNEFNTNTNIFVRPFIGLSARIDLAVKFGK